MDCQEKQKIAWVIEDFRSVLETLDCYDHEQLVYPKSATANAGERITYEEAMEAIAVLKEMFNDSDIFGTEKDASFKSSLGQIYQTFDGKELYPTAEIKAAMLLYLVVKNHSFVDGNKRIAAFVFLWFLSRNGLLYKADGSKNIADGMLVALTLLIAESKPEEREIMVKLATNLLGM
ncbi:MAG: Fic family protein [Fibrobacter sp.]|nr:Fic family protein [Fibrobacter sp.]